MQASQAALFDTQVDRLAPGLTRQALYFLWQLSWAEVAVGLGMGLLVAVPPARQASRFETQVDRLAPGVPRHLSYCVMQPSQAALFETQVDRLAPGLERHSLYLSLHVSWPWLAVWSAGCAATRAADEARARMCFN
jgi:hypothetical protein